jgi:hypothetical protein
LAGGGVHDFTLRPGVIFALPQLCKQYVKPEGIPTRKFCGLAKFGENLYCRVLTFLGSVLRRTVSLQVVTVYLKS